MATRRNVRPENRPLPTFSKKRLQDVYRRLSDLGARLVTAENTLKWLPRERQIVVHNPQWAMPAEIRDAVRHAMYQVLDDRDAKAAIAAKAAATKPPKKSRSKRR